MNKIFAALKGKFGLILIAVAFLSSAFVVYLNNRIDENVYYIVKTGDTLHSVVTSYETSIERIIDENYPDVSERHALTPGMKIKIPSGAKTRTITISLAHWQLETGVRDAINVMAKEYHKLHPNVRIVQNAIPYTTYGQWFTAQMLGGTAPDLIECGLGVPYPLLVGYYLRYFTPLTEYVLRPNPYNANNEFSNTILRDTTKDGLKNCYNIDVQEYMTIGFSQFLTRFFYNKTLYQKLTGRTEPPKHYADFIAACAEIKKHKFYDKNLTAERGRLESAIMSVEKKISLAKGNAAASLTRELETAKERFLQFEEKVPRYVPIANSKYHMDMLERNAFDVLTTRARERIDFNHDCTVSAVEQYVGMKSGVIDMDYGPYRAKFEVVAGYSSNSPTGFPGLNLDDAQFQFVQQRAVFIATGTWTAMTLTEQAKDNGFEIGVFDYPYPDDRSPELYRHFFGAAFEDPGTGFAFGCPTPESAPERKRAAIDFLLFLLSRDNNVSLNSIIGWIPAVRGAPGEGILKYFVPHADGVTPGINLNIGGESLIRWQQLYALYQIGQLSYEKLRDEFTPYYLARGYADYLAINKNWRRSIISDEKIIASLRAKAFMTPEPERRNEYWSKYRFASMRLIGREMEVCFDRANLAFVERGGKMDTAYRAR